MGRRPTLTFTHTSTVLDAGDVRRAVSRIAHEIVERNKGAEQVVLVGLLSRGAELAQRLAARIGEIEGTKPAAGAIDIGLHRDDIGLRELHALEPTTLPPVDGKVVVLVDDVLYTGRSARAAMDALVDFGRPRAIQLAVLVDRGHRELPIRADYVGKNIPTRRQEEVAVHLAERDGVDEVLLGETT